jgi:excisionase family DNA binding protein
MNTKQNELELFSVKEVSGLLKFHPRTVWKMAQTGELPRPVKIGNKAVRWRRSDLQKFLAEAK